MTKYAWSYDIVYVAFAFFKLWTVSTNLISNLSVKPTDCIVLDECHSHPRYLFHILPVVVQ